MKLTKTSAYAAIAMCHLGTRRDEGPVQARQVAEHLGLPLDSTLKILQALARQQLLRSRLGRGGGYAFHLDPAEVSLLDIIEAIDGTIRAEVPVDVDRSQLAQPVGNLRRACDHLAATLRRELREVTIEQLVQPVPADTQPA